LADKRQKRKRFLTLDRRNLSVDRQKLSFPIQQNQRVAPSSFLTIKNRCPNLADGARPHSAGDGGRVSTFLSTPAADVLARAVSL
jgi:hypothetical protein